MVSAAMDQTVFIVDEFVSAPGKGRELLDAYRARYAPGAIARGMQPGFTIVSPPVWLDDQANRLLISWTVSGAGGWWGQAIQSRGDPAIAEFWASVAPLVASRSRHSGATPEAIAELTDV